jgi:mannose-6-phosphate isomerase
LGSEAGSGKHDPYNYLWSCILSTLYPIRLASSLHETIWGGRRLADDQWKDVPPGDTPIGESWETEVSNVVLNGTLQGHTLGAVVKELGVDLLGPQAIEVFGYRFPLLAKFIDAHAKLSVQVHPKDDYANQYENGKLGKTEFWYILAAEPGAKIVHGFQHDTDTETVRRAIEEVKLETLMHEEEVHAGDVIFVPAGTVHAIGGGILLYELQEYSDVTYRMYDYGRLTAAGKLRELHIDRSLDVTHFTTSPQIKVHPVQITENTAYEDRCLVACRYFVTREIVLKQGTFKGQTTTSCIILTSLSANAHIHYGKDLAHNEPIKRGESLVLPAGLGAFALEGEGSLLYSYVPSQQDEAWLHWKKHQL